MYGVFVSINVSLLLMRVSSVFELESKRKVTQWALSVKFVSYISVKEFISSL